MLSKGIGIRASCRPIAACVKKPGETIGHYWYIPNVRHTAQFPFVLIDVNYWKSFIHAGMATALAGRGCISLFGSAKTDHTLFAEHIARSERWVEVTGPYGTVREWSPLPGKPDNHFLDGLVGAAAAASMIGCRTPAESTGHGRTLVAPGKQRIRNLADIGRQES
jgi:hypothetical protein